MWQCQLSHATQRNNGRGSHNWMNGKQSWKRSAKALHRPGGSKSPLRPKWVVLSTVGNRTVSRHSKKDEGGGHLGVGGWGGVFRSSPSPHWTFNRPGHYIHRMIFTQHWFYLKPWVLVPADQMTARVFFFFPASLGLNWFKGRRGRQTGSDSERERKRVTERKRTFLNSQRI